jgi:rod shape determining protein RodA
MDIGAYGNDRTERIMRERVQTRWAAAYAPVRHLDPMLVVSALLLAGIGLVAIYSSKLQALTVQGLPTSTYISRQGIALLVGLVALGVAAFFDYRHLRGYSAVLYLGSLFLLVLTLTPLGTEINGSQRWLILGGFQLQPSELAKLAVLASVAALLHERKGEPGLPTMMIGLVLVAVPMLLVFLQPDLGTSIVFVWLAAVLFLVGGVKARYLIGLTVAAVAGVAAALRLELIQAYQLQRLTAFLDAGDPSLAQTAAFHTRQSLIAIGSGQFFGKGLFEGTQTSLSYVPENHTDFIFTVIGEEFGFIGAAAVLGLFLVFIWRGLRIAVLAKDLFGTLLAAGIIGVFTLQVFMNVGMTLGIMPVTGIPLPFVSYGGTSLIVWMAMAGLLLNIHMRRF